MSLPDDLLAQARHLAAKDPRRPAQANLRRAISAAYYALFHELTEGVGRTVVGARRGERVLREAVQRACTHTSMNDAASAFLKTSPPAKVAKLTGGAPLGPDIVQIAEHFSGLQEARHQADYDLSRTFSRRETLDHVEQADAAIRAWQRARATSEGRTFAIALLLFRSLRP